MIGLHGTSNSGGNVDVFGNYSMGSDSKFHSFLMKLDRNLDIKHASEKSLCQSLKEIKQYLQSILAKNQFHDQGYLIHFHEFLYRVYGYVQGTGDSVDKDRSLLNALITHKVYDLFMELMDAEKGPLFQLLLCSHSSITQQYEFPMNKLSYNVRLAVDRKEWNHLSDFYYQKIPQQELSGQPFILLNMFEYFVFCFAYYPLSVGAQKPPTQLKVLRGTMPSLTKKAFPLFASKTRRKVEYLDPYIELLKNYLQYFFPNQQKQPTEKTGNIEAELKSKVEARYPELADKFLHVITDYWINQTSHSVSEDQTMFHPEFLMNPKRVMTVTRALIRHFLSSDLLHLKVLNFSKPSDFPGRKSVFTKPLMIIQKPLFHFLKNAFSQWPRSVPLPFLQLTRIYLSYLAPWKYHNESVNHYFPFVLSNWCFYSVVFVDFLRLVTTMLQIARRSDFQLIAEVLNIFVEGRMISFLRTVDSVLSKRATQESLKPEESSLLYDHVLGTLGDISLYKSIFSEKNMKIVTHFIEESQSLLFYGSWDKGEKRDQWFELKNGNKDLEQMIKNLGLIFDIKIEKPSKRSFNVWSKERQKRREPESNPQSMLLSPRGKDQIIKGVRKCSKIDIRYIGDPIYAPTTNFECDMLVDFWLMISEWLNETLLRIGPSGQPGKFRFNLRFLASYAGIFWSMIGIITISLFVFFIILIWRWNL